MNRCMQSVLTCSGEAAFLGTAQADWSRVRCHQVEAQLEPLGDHWNAMLQAVVYGTSSLAWVAVQV